jgi:hypothetical protein
MSDKDFVINTTMRVPDGTAISNKPCYLITLDEKTGVGKNITHRRFIAVDLPTLMPSYIQTKGYYTEAEEEMVVKEFKNILQGMDKEQMIELYVPWQHIKHIRSLIFKAK